MDNRSTLELVNETLAVVSLILGGGLVVLDGAPLLEIVIVCVIVIGGVDQWLALRKLSKETRDVGNRLLFLVGVTLISLGSF
jgi:hypothetical protein